MSENLVLSEVDGFPLPTAQRAISIALANNGTTTCSLYGYAELVLLDADGRALPFVFERSRDQVVTGRNPDLVLLEPGQEAYVTINKEFCEGNRGYSRTVLLTPPGGNSSLRLHATFIAIPYCPGRTIVHVSPIANTLRGTLSYGGP